MAPEVHRKKSLLILGRCTVWQSIWEVYRDDGSGSLKAVPEYTYASMHYIEEWWAMLC